MATESVAVPGAPGAPAPAQLPVIDKGLKKNAIGYISGFNSGQSCPSDADGYYGGCFDWWGMSSTTVDPYQR